MIDFKFSEKEKELLKELRKAIVDYAIREHVYFKWVNYGEYDFSKEDPYDRFKKDFPCLDGLCVARKRTADHKHYIDCRLDLKTYLFYFYLDDGLILAQTFSFQDKNLQDKLKNDCTNPAIKEEVLQTVINGMKTVKFEDFFRIVDGDDSFFLENGVVVDLYEC